MKPDDDRALPNAGRTGAAGRNGGGRRSLARRLAGRMFRRDAHLREVLRLAASGFMLRGAATALRFAIAVIVGRMLGAEGAGLYFFAVSVVTTASIFARAGVSNMLVRYIAENVAKKDWATGRFVFVTTQRLVGGLCALIGVVIIATAPWTATAIFNKPQNEMALILAGLSLLPFTLSWTIGDSLRALRRIPAAQLVKAGIPAVVTVILVYPLARLWSSDGAIVAFGLGLAVAVLWGRYSWGKQWKKVVGPGSDSGESNLTLRVLLISSWALFGAGLANLGIQNVASIVLGVWGSNSDIGVFNVANRVASLLLLPYFGMTGILSPKFVQLHTLGKTVALQELIRSSTWLLLLITIPAALVIFLAAGPVMQVFGPHFEQSVPILRILMVATVLQVSTGPAGSLLMMCGKERAMLTLSLATLVVAIGLCIVATRFYGVIGLSWAIVAAIVTQNVAQVAMVRKFLGFWPLGFIAR